MRYRFNGIVVKSENAAKPGSQRSKFIASEIRQLEPVEVSLDYGCGKLRYLENFLEVSDEIFLHDSEIQLSRQQVVFGQKTSILEFVQSKNNVSLFTRCQLYKRRAEFDRIFCVNVLSAIPILSVRWRVIQNCFRLLKPKGQLVITHQYRNSDFSRMRQMPNAYEFRDGFIINSLRGHSFYSTFPRSTLVDKLIECGFSIKMSKIFDGTVFVVAMKPEEPKH